MPRVRENDAISFIEKAKLKWGNKFDYSLVDYISYKTKVKIICPVHGVIEKAPYAHLKAVVRNARLKTLVPKNQKRLKQKNL